MKNYNTDEIKAFIDRFWGATLSRTVKPIIYDAPVMVQRFGADPFALVYDGRVYLYMTADTPEYDSNGNVTQNTYSKIDKLNVVSSSDLINWTDHGWVNAAGISGAAKWGGNSWAPAAACKEIDGRMKFFLYFANGGNGIGVLEADSPTGPFTDPIGKALISRSTPNCANVTWLFDPAVFVDSDGSAYIYFGGGIPSGKTAFPGTARVCKLGADMISLDGVPSAIDVPYLFEDSGINRIGDKYYYSYCTNWQVTPEAKTEYGFDNAQIAYMVSDSPMGPFTYEGVVLKNPGTYYGCYGNNHHCMFEFKGNWYIAYHTQLLEKPMGITGGYRSTSVSRISVDADGRIPVLHTVKRDQLKQTNPFDPYKLTSAATMCTNGGVSTAPRDEKITCGDMVLTDIETGDWTALRGVDFGDGPASLSMTVRPNGHSGAVQVRIDSAAGPVIGYLDWDAGEVETMVSAALISEAQGVHNLLFVFDGDGYDVVSWQFAR